jgi:DUF971 family protein
MVMVRSGVVRSGRGWPATDGRPPRKCDNPRLMTDTTGPTAANATPTRIHAERGAGTLEIDWADGHATVYGFEALRWLCPCAYCRGEAGMPGWLDSAPTLTSQQIQLTDLHLVGNYAVSPHWADGHGTGYYPFRLLRDRCPCPECTARRARESTDQSGRPSSAGTHEEHR